MIRRVAFTLACVLAFCAGTLFAVVTEAQESGAGLVEVCRAGLGYSTEQGNQCPERSWERPAAGKAVLSCGAVTDPVACTWFHPELRYRAWETIPDDELVLTCEADVPVGPFGSVDPCGSGAHESGKPRVAKSAVVGAVVGPIVNGQGTAMLSWVAPTERTDGEPLPASELAGYTLFYGTRSRSGRDCAPPMGPTDSTCYPSRTQFDNGAATSGVLTLELTESTTIYFALAARDTGGLMSDYSNERAKVFTLELEELPPAEPAEPQLLEVGVSITCTTDQPRVLCTFTVGDPE